MYKNIKYYIFQILNQHLHHIKIIQKITVKNIPKLDKVKYLKLKKK